MNSTKRLPIVKVPYRMPDPSWIAEHDPVTKACTNMDSYYLPEAMVEAEVLQLNLNTGGMRIRLLNKIYSKWHPKGQVVSYDVSISYFYAAFDIVGKGQQ